ncbi:tripartite tricarboxylate transporter substrate binding protein [uncultured Pseudacidovorax sp.]|uniref:Bug family tripartite tricarboxylate transporter substrate binding protein n=1 Tax=uncultured Pseudacidovorax sp. TaxID=679313 RepID=UPI0025F5ED4F|nr:tripartite tricarboxylate transporter substrate binding protein [uncultured Pseudacidovorax sp.]
MIDRRQWLAGACALPLATLWSPAWSDEAYPSRPIRILVPFTPGGSSDILARAIGLELGQAWSKPVVVENIPGAGGTVATERAARAAPDGYTLFMGHTGTLAINPWLYPQQRIDTARAFAPVALVARVPNVLVVHPSVPATSLAELIGYSKANPDALAYGSGGNGSAAHLTMEYLKLRTGLKALHVPYKGTAPSVTDLLAGQVQLLFTGSPALMPHIRSGAMRAIAVSSQERISQLPQVPTVAESKAPGAVGFEADQWYGLVTAAGTPPAVVERLNRQVNAALASDAVRGRLTAEGAQAIPSSPDRFASLIKAETARWGDTVRTARVTVE